MSTFPSVAQEFDTHLQPAGAPRPLRVLLVEDNVDDALLLRRHLSKAGFAPELHRVETSDKMLLALAEPWDCILADYNLPQFSAPEALKLLQETGHDIPFIMMSGAVSEDTAVAAMRAGAHDYVSKQNLARLAPAIERELTEAASRRTKRATERALQSSEERFHRLVEATPLALLIIDTQGQVTYSNGGAKRLLGSGTGVTGGIRLERVFSAVDFGKLSESTTACQHIAGELYKRVEGHQEETWEGLCQHADGSPLPVLLGAAVLNPEASFEQLQLAVFFVDLTEQKRSEEVLRRTEKLAAAGRLAASIAHEINNPLEAITNCLYLLEQSILAEDARTYLQMAQRELDRVTHITTQTLRFYRQSTRPVPTDVPDLIESVLALYEARIRDNSIEVVRDYAGAPPIIALDGEIRQVLANLIGNAVDAMTGGPQPRKLVLRARPCYSWHTHGQGLAIVIADRGSGMSPETLQRIYEPFFSTKGITGTGLGLWVSCEIVTKHNGRIQVRTKQNEGTIFRIVFPLQSSLLEHSHESGMPTLH
jgi:PAS domain S-box-containing protein